MKRIIPLLCMIQEGSLSPAQIRQIESVSAVLYKQHFDSNYRLLPLWLSIPCGQAFVAAQPSRASSVMFPVPDQLPEMARHHFMREFSTAWMQITQCDKNQLIVVAPDQTEALNLIRANSQRFRPGIRLLAQVSLALRLFSSRLWQGHAQASINFMY